MTAIRQLEDARDEVRTLEESKIHFQKEGALYGIDYSKEIAYCDVQVERAKMRLCMALELVELEEAIVVQREIMARFAVRTRMDEDKAGYWFAKSYAAKFRSVWNQGFREIPEIEYLMYEKTGP